MAMKITSMIALTALIALSTIQGANGLYFYLGNIYNFWKGQQKCFKDELIKYSELHAKVSILDQHVLQLIQDNRGQLGIEMTLNTPYESIFYSTERVINLVLQPDVEFTYNTTANGEHKICLSIVDQVYELLPELKQIRTELYFTNEYRKATEMEQKNKRLEGNGKKALVQQKEQPLPDNAARQVHFSPLKKRSTRIKQLVDDIIAHQEYERQKEQKYSSNLESLNSGFKFVVMLQIGVLVAAAIFSVISLRKFFVRKHIYYERAKEEQYSRILHI